MCILTIVVDLGLLLLVVSIDLEAYLGYMRNFFFMKIVLWSNGFELGLGSWVTLWLDNNSWFTDLSIVYSKVQFLAADLDGMILKRSSLREITVVSEIYEKDE